MDNKDEIIEGLKNKIRIYEALHKLNCEQIERLIDLLRNSTNLKQGIDY